MPILAKKHTFDPKLWIYLLYVSKILPNHATLFTKYKLSIHRLSKFLIWEPRAVFRVKPRWGRESWTKKFSEIFFEKLFGPPTKEGIGPCNSPSSVRPSALFSKTTPWNFWNFAQTLTWYRSKSNRRNFWHNSGCPSRGLFRVKMPPSSQNWHFYSYCEKLVPWILIKPAKSCS